MVSRKIVGNYSQMKRTLFYAITIGAVTFWLYCLVHMSFNHLYRSLAVGYIVSERKKLGKPIFWFEIFFPAIV